MFWKLKNCFPEQFSNGPFYFLNSSKTPVFPYIIAYTYCQLIMPVSHIPFCLIFYYCLVHNRIYHQFWNELGFSFFLSFFPQKMGMWIVVEVLIGFGLCWFKNWLPWLFPLFYIKYQILLNSSAPSMYLHWLVMIFLYICFYSHMASTNSFRILQI